MNDEAAHRRLECVVYARCNQLGIDPCVMAPTASIRSTAAIGQISAADSAKRVSTTSGAMQNLGGSVETVQIIIGNLFLPKLTEIANTVRGVVDQFSHLNPESTACRRVLQRRRSCCGCSRRGFVLLAPFIAALLRLRSRCTRAVLGAVAVPVRSLARRRLVYFRSSRRALAVSEMCAVDAFDRIRSILDDFHLVFEQALSGGVVGALDTFRAIIGGSRPSLAVSSRHLCFSTMGTLDDLIATEGRATAPRCADCGHSYHDHHQDKR